MLTAVQTEVLSCIQFINRRVFTYSFSIIFLIIIIIIKIKFYTAIIHGKILNNLSEASAL